MTEPTQTADPAPAAPATDQAVPASAQGPAAFHIALRRHVVWLLAAAVLLGVDTELQLEAIPRWRSGTGGSALLLIALWVAFVQAARWVLDPRPLLVLRAEGVEDRGWGLIPWSDVAGWSLLPEPRGDAFAVHLAKGARPPLRPRLWALRTWLVPPFGARRLVWRAARLEAPPAAAAAAARALRPDLERPAGG